MQIFKNIKIFSNFTMKTLKSKLFAGALTLASFGFFGNVNAQNMEIKFNCYDKNKNEIPCFNEDGSLKTDNLLVTGTFGKKNISIKYEEPKNKGWKRIILEKEVEVKNLYSKNPEFKKLMHTEIFIFIHNKECSTNLPTDALHYSRRQYYSGIKDYSKSCVNISSEEEAYEILGEKQFKRTKEIINAFKDSLKLVNLIKKEYQIWKTVEELAYFNSADRYFKLYETYPKMPTSFYDNSEIKKIGDNCFIDDPCFMDDTDYNNQ